MIYCSAGYNCSNLPVIYFSIYDGETRSIGIGLNIFGIYSTISFALCISETVPFRDKHESPYDRPSVQRCWSRRHIHICSHNMLATSLTLCPNQADGVKTKPSPGPRGVSG